MKDWFNKLSPTMQIVVIVILIIAVYMAYKSGKSFLQKTVVGAENLGEVAALNAQGIKRSYTDSQYKSFANQLYYAMDGTGTDEDAIYAVFKKMNNDLDIILLTKAFGFKDSYDLQTWLLDDLSPAELKMLNSQLENKGITKTF